MPSLIVVALASTVALMAGQPAGPYTGPMPNAPMPTVTPGAPAAARPLPKPANMTSEERQARSAEKAQHQQAKAARKAQTDANKAARTPAPHPPY